MFKRSWGTVFFVISLFSFSWPHYLKLSMNAFSYGLQGWMGPNYSISTACATSNFCILNAANHIIRGEAVSIFALLCALRFNDALFLSKGVNKFSKHEICLQDVMLCGGSDATIIPIGILLLLILRGLCEVIMP